MTAAWIARAAIALFVLVLRLPTLFEPAWYSDDGFFMSVAWLTTKGLPLYSGVYDNSPPGIYWLYRAMLVLGAREHHLVVQAVASIAVLSAVLLTFEIARRLRAESIWPATLAAASTGFALSLPTLDGDVLNVELAGLPFFLAALLLGLHRSLPAAAFSGVLLGCALAIRPSYALDALALLVALLAVRPVLPRLVLAAAGLGCAVGAVALGLWAQGSLGAYVNVVLPSDHSYLLWANGGSLVPLYARLALLAVAAAAGLILARDFGTRLLALWVPAAVAGASLTPREFTHYAHEAIPALSICAAMIAARAGMRWRPAAAIAAVAALIVAAEAVLVLPAQEVARMQGLRPPAPLLHNFAYARLPAYYANWFAFVTGAKDEVQYQAWFPSDARMDSAESGRLHAAAPGRNLKVLVLGDQPWLFVQGGLEPATPFIATNSSFWRVAWAPRDVARSISEGCADFVIDIDVGGAWARELRSDSYVRVSRTPWPTFIPKQRSAACAAADG